MQGDFAPVRKRVVLLESEFALRPEQPWQGRWDQQKIVGVIVPEAIGEMRA